MKGTRTKVSLFCVSLIVIVFASDSQAKIEPEDMVGIWLFDEESGKTAKDASNTGNDGQLKGDLKWEAGKFGNALSFPGKDESFVEVPANKSLDLTTFSFTMWVKVEATGNYQSVLIKTADGLLENYSGYIYAGRKVFWTRFTSGGPTQWGFQKFGTTIVTDNEWHHLAGTYDLKSVKSYVDGVVEAEADFDGEPDTSPGPLTIGDCLGFPYPVLGLLDDVGLFSVALTQDDIQQIMAEGLSPMLAVSPLGKVALTWGKLKAP